MPVGDNQKLITPIVSKVLNETPQTQKFTWFINQHQKQHFKTSFNLIDSIYLELNGNDSSKRTVQLESDAYFGGKYNFLFEYDEFQHFTSALLKTLSKYPENLKLNYSIDDWKKWCVETSHKADKYRFNKTTADFNFQSGRTCQRAYLDCFRDFLPQHNGLNPTLRISEFEVIGVDRMDANSIDKVKELIDNKLKFI